ncbi:hypothetical protein CaCOL14_011055 [Colletotrichum acutatum]
MFRILAVSHQALHDSGQILVDFSSGSGQNQKHLEDAFLYRRYDENSLGRLVVSQLQLWLAEVVKLFLDARNYFITTKVSPNICQKSLALIF